MDNWEVTGRDQVAHLKQRLFELESGKCRFNCRDSKENWLQGYIEAQHNTARGIDMDAVEAYKDWRSEQK